MIAQIDHDCQQLLPQVQPSRSYPVLHDAQHVASLGSHLAQFSTPQSTGVGVGVGGIDDDVTTRQRK